MGRNVARLWLWFWVKPAVKVLQALRTASAVCRITNLGARRETNLSTNGDNQGCDYLAPRWLG